MIRGTFAVCPECALEVSIDHIVNISPSAMPGFVEYRTVHGCGAQLTYSVEKDVHAQGVAYLRQTAENVLYKTEIESPISPEEELLTKWHNALDQVGSVEDLMRAL